MPKILSTGLLCVVGLCVVQNSVISVNDTIPAKDSETGNDVSPVPITLQCARNPNDRNIPQEIFQMRQLYTSSRVCKMYLVTSSGRKVCMMCDGYRPCDFIYTVDPVSYVGYSNMTIRQATCLDAGRYTCMVDNDPSMASLDMLPGVPYMETSFEEGQSVRSGTTLNVTCRCYSTVLLQWVWSYLDNDTNIWTPIPAVEASVTNTYPLQHDRCTKPWRSSLSYRVREGDEGRWIRCLPKYEYKGQWVCGSATETVLNITVSITTTTKPEHTHDGENHGHVLAFHTFVAISSALGVGMVILTILFIARMGTATQQQAPQQVRQGHGHRRTRPRPDDGETLPQAAEEELGGGEEEGGVGGGGVGGGGGNEGEERGGNDREASRRTSQDFTDIDSAGLGVMDGLRVTVSQRGPQ